MKLIEALYNKGIEDGLQPLGSNVVLYGTEVPADHWSRSLQLDDEAVESFLRRGGAPEEVIGNGVFYLYTSQDTFEELGLESYHSPGQEQALLHRDYLQIPDMGQTFHNPFIALRVDGMRPHERGITGLNFRFRHELAHALQPFTEELPTYEDPRFVWGSRMVATPGAIACASLAYTILTEPRGLHSEAIIAAGAVLAAGLFGATSVFTKTVLYTASGLERDANRVARRTKDLNPLRLPESTV